jgi:hypothetical protein
VAGGAGGHRGADEGRPRHADRGRARLYWFLAFFPALIALIGLVSVLRLRPDLVDSLVGGVEAALPSGAAQVLSQAVQTASQQAGTSLPAILGLAVAVWSAPPRAWRPYKPASTLPTGFPRTAGCGGRAMTASVDYLQRQVGC